MGDRHFGQAAHQQKRDDSPNQVADKHRRARESDGKTGAKKEARADGSADSDHRELPCGQIAMQPLLTLRNRVEARVRRSLHPATVMD